MKQLYLSCAILFMALAISAQQVRYVDPLFSVGPPEKDITYATNITIITGMPAPQELKMDVYTPIGDTETERPVIVYFHTGSFLPQYVNNQITGSRTDSTVVEMCKRFAARGYVAIAATYRQGWLPTAPDQNVRTGTLLNAAYRGIQDARALIRFLRMSTDATAGGTNPYGIDTSRIVLWGQGTGGYISLGAAFLDDYDEIVLDKFIDSGTALPFVIEGLNGDVYGLNQTPLNIPNHVGYSSDFAMAVNMGGALGDISWVDGTGNEPLTVGYHVVADPFAPYGDGAVIVPTTNEFVVNVSGTLSVVEYANELGINDPLIPANSADLPGQFSELSEIVNARAIALQSVNIPGRDSAVGADNIYPFITSGPASGPWDWWDLNTLRFIINIYNSQVPASLQRNADTLNRNGLILNMDMSAAKANRYLDTIMAHFIPRACEGLQLPSCAITGTEDLIQADQVDLKAFPNPANALVNLTSDEQHPMRNVILFDVNGRFLRSYDPGDSSFFQIDRNGLPPGNYFVKVIFDEGVALQRLIFH